MAETLSILEDGHGSVVAEWSSLADTDTDPAWISIPHRSEMTVQLMEVESGSPSVSVQVSLNLDADASKVWGAANDPSNTAIALTVAGDVATVLESGVLMRPLNGGASSSARVRIKANRIR